MLNFEINVSRKANGWLIAAIERDDMIGAGSVTTELVATTPAQVAAAVRSLVVSREKEEADAALNEAGAAFENLKNPTSGDDQHLDAPPSP